MVLSTTTLEPSGTSAVETENGHQHELDQLKRKIEQLQHLYLNRGERKPSIVILGAGYAGVTTAAGLQGVEAEVTLINQHPYHTLTTLLHEPAVGHGHFEDVTVSLPELFEGTGIRLQYGEVTGIDPGAQVVHVQAPTGPHLVPYDFLVVALGSQPEFYNIPGLAQNAFTLSKWSEAARIHLRVEETLIDYKENPDEDWRAHIVIGGAGLTGVELAGELAEVAATLARSYGVPRGKLRVTLMDGAPTVLASCADCQGLIIPVASKVLNEKGVRILTNTIVKAVRPNEVVLSNGKTIQAGLIIWTGGVRGHRVLEQSGLAVDRQKRALVNGYLQAQGYPEVFVLGDSASGRDAKGRVLPPTAQVAIQQGPALAENFHRLLNGKPLETCYPKLTGMFLSIGHKHAIGVIQNRIPFYGDDARFLKNLIGYRYLARLGGLELALGKWLGWSAATKAIRPRPRIPFGLRLGNATLAGLVGAAVMTAAGFIATSLGLNMDTPAMLSQAFNLTALGGWIVHAWIGVMLAWVLAFGFDYPLEGPMAAKGALVGFLAFLLAQVVAMPMMGAGVFSSAMANSANLVLASLGGHLIYGLVTGWVYGETLSINR